MSIFLLFLSLFLNKTSLPAHCMCRGLLFHLITLNDTCSIGLPWMSDRPVAEACTYTTYNIHWR